MREGAGGPNVAEGPKEDADEKMQETCYGCRCWLPWKWVEMWDGLLVDMSVQRSKKSLVLYSNEQIDKMKNMVAMQFVLHVLPALLPRAVPLPGERRSKRQPGQNVAREGWTISQINLLG